ncbi:MAG: hypothetical protein WC323_01915 [Patescibacteria group bacterium]|jgi:predicted methyltransferase
MSEISIQINWIYFLGIIGSLILVAWYSGGRFTKLETDVDWIKNILKNLKIIFDNKEFKAFEKGSPVELTEKGHELLEKSGFKKYIDDRKKEFASKCQSAEQIRTAYDV